MPPLPPVPPIQTALPAVTYRTAREADYAAIAGALQRWWQLPGFDTPAAARERAALLPRLFLQHFSATSLVAEREGDLAAFLVGFLSADNHDEAYIHFVGVHPDMRRDGLGRALYERFFDTAARAGRSVVKCVTTPGNSTSIAFHLAMGFEACPGPIDAGPVSALADYDGPGLHRVSFARRLTAPSPLSPDSR